MGAWLLLCLLPGVMADLALLHKESNLYINDTSLSQERLGDPDGQVADGHVKRKILPHHTLYTWILPIYYHIEHVNWQKDVIRESINHVQRETCLRFKEMIPNYSDWLRDNKPAYIRFVDPGDGSCTAMVGRRGRTPGTSQQIKLSPNCIQYYSRGTIYHMILHTLGFWHEHSRPDRDAFVKINYHNMDPSSHPQFDKTLTKRVNQDILAAVPYDYSSVMHYTAKASSTTGGYTIESYDPMYLAAMGNSNAPTSYDFQALSMAYCDNKICGWGHPKPSCHNGGYQDTHDSSTCSSCKCRPGFKGRLCKRDDPGNDNRVCGHAGSVFVESSQKCTGVHVLGFNPKHENIYCNWRISTYRRHVIGFWFKSLDIQCNTAAICNQYVEIKYKDRLLRRGPRFCCKDLHRYHQGALYGKDGNFISSDDNEMLVHFDVIMSRHSAFRPSFQLCFKMMQYCRVKQHGGLTSTEIGWLNLDMYTREQNIAQYGRRSSRCKFDIAVKPCEGKISWLEIKVGRHPEYDENNPIRHRLTHAAVFLTEWAEDHWNVTRFHHNNGFDGEHRVYEYRPLTLHGGAVQVTWRVSDRNKLRIHVTCPAVSYFGDVYFGKMVEIQHGGADANGAVIKDTSLTFYDRRHWKGKCFARTTTDWVR